MESHATSHSSRAECSATCIHLTVTATSQLIFHFSTISTIINKFSQRALPFEINFRPWERFFGSSIFRFEKFAIISWLVVYLPRRHARESEREWAREKHWPYKYPHFQFLLLSAVVAVAYQYFWTTLNNGREHRRACRTFEPTHTYVIRCTTHFLQFFPFPSFYSTTTTFRSSIS